MSSSSSSPQLAADVGDAKGANLARTLLINRPGSEQQDVSFFGYEYVSPTYQQVALTSGLLNARRMLFGGDPDLSGMNYMAWQYMRILHATEFESYVTALDPRITYLNNKSLVDYDYGESVAANANALQFLGTPNLGGASGRLVENWRIERTTPTSFRILNYRSGVAESYSPNIVNNVTDYMTMTGHSGYKVRLFLDNADRDAWEVSYLAKPQSEMDPVNRAATLSKLGTESYLELFPYRTPYNLFRELWEKHQELAYKLSGALLALIYRTQEIRISG